MKKLFLLSILILFAAIAVAQENCLPVYDLPVKKMQLSFGKLLPTLYGGLVLVTQVQ